MREEAQLSVGAQVEVKDGEVPAASKQIDYKSREKPSRNSTMANK